MLWALCLAAADIQDSTYHMEQWLEREVNGERERMTYLMAL